jgi:hypothetical protein
MGLASIEGLPTMEQILKRIRPSRRVSALTVATTTLPRAVPAAVGSRERIARDRVFLDDTGPAQRRSAAPVARVTKRVDEGGCLGDAETGEGTEGTLPPCWDGHAAERMVDVVIQWARP